MDVWKIPYRLLGLVGFCQHPQSDQDASTRKSQTGLTDSLQSICEAFNTGRFWEEDPLVSLDSQRRPWSPGMCGGSGRRKGAWPWNQAQASSWKEGLFDSEMEARDGEVRGG